VRGHVLDDEVDVIVERIRVELSRRTPRTLDDPRQRRAAVLMPLYKEGNRIWTLLTKRTESVAVHKGQISFPGGQIEPEDPDALHAALRETWEEVGILPRDVTVLGRLDDVSTAVSSFIIQPCVGLMPHPYPLRLQAGEIGAVVRAPLELFLRRDRIRVEYRERDGVTHPVYFYDHGEHVIWGATARIIRGFVHAVFREQSEDMP